MPPRKKKPADDTYSFNSQLSGDMSVGGDGSRRVSTAPGKGVIEFLTGNKRSNYSTPVYLFIVFVVSVVLWGVMPWIITAYAELNLEERIAALEAGGGTGGLSDTALGELQKLKAEVQANLAAMKGIQSDVGTTIETFRRQQSSAGSAAAGDLSGVTADLTKLEEQLTALGVDKQAVDASMASLKTEVSDTQTQAKEHSTSIYNLEQKLKDVHYSIDGVASTVASKLGGGWGFGGSSKSTKSEKPNFALKHAGAYVEDVVYPGRGLVGMFKSAVYRQWGVNFDYQNPNYNLLDSSNEPGECWCFPGQQANITIRLISRMRPSAFFLHHIYMEYYTEAKIDHGVAAPKDFSVLGVDDEGEHLLGHYTYDAAGQKEKGLEQTFTVHESAGARVFESMKVAFQESANWGSDREFTCVYQFGVHGVGVNQN